MDALTACWIVAALVGTMAAVGGCLWVVLSARWGQPHSFDGHGFAVFFMLGVFALVALAAGLARIDAPWAVAGIVAVNVLIQPLSCYLFAVGVFKLGMALAGRVVYAWRTVPPAEYEAAEYRGLLRYCSFQGVVACLVASGLAWFCFRPLL